MKVKLYVTYTDGRKIVYNGTMTKPKPESSIVFDYYCKIKVIPTIKQMIAKVINDEGDFICKREVKFPWNISQYGNKCYFGITICGDRVVHDTVTTLINKNDTKEYGYVIQWVYDENGHIMHDNNGNPLGKTIRVRLEHDNGAKTINEQNLIPNIRKLMSSINNI